MIHERRQKVTEGKIPTFAFFFFLLFGLCSFLFSQTIEEKREAFNVQKDQKQLRFLLKDLNKQLHTLRNGLEEKYELVHEYYREGAKEEEFEELLKEVNELRVEIGELEKEWRSFAVEEMKKDDEGYALWDQEETTLSQLIMEYGSTDYLYIIPPEILSMKVHMHSSIPIPRESWSALLEIVLSHNGIGVKQLNVYTRQLYILKQDLIAVDKIINTPKDLASIPPKSRVVYIFNPPPERIKGVSHFFERFRDPKMTFVYQVGYKIAIVSSKEEVEKLLTLYRAVWEKENEKITRILPMSRISPEEMEKILKAYFGDSAKKPRMGLMRGEGDDLIILPLKDEGSLVLIGPKDMVERAERLIQDTQGQIEDPMEMTVFSYTCRHSDPIEVSDVLEKVYTSLIYSGIRGEDPKPQDHPLPPTRPLDPDNSAPGTPSLYGPPPYSPVVTPLPAVAGNIDSQREKSYTTNFIPFPKTGTIMMVVRRDTLPKIKDLLRKLDVPKKMVQIEVLLFEKRIRNENNFGLNILRLGSAASDSHETGTRYMTSAGSTPMPPYSPTERKGVFDFFIFRKASHGWPAFDIAYNFLMSQEDVRINAAPSVTTLNQTAAQITLVDEVSITNGASPVDSNAGVVFKESFSRADYGTTVVITPTVHEPEFPEEDTHYVTLETNIQFDTIKKTSKDPGRPDVFKRHVENQVRVADGETVILGGLRQKTAEDSNSKLPFLGELPGLGKFFGDSRMTDEETEMFIFITPRIIFDGKGEMEKARYLELIKRPGDVPEFLERFETAKKAEKKRLFNNSLKLFFGKVT
jgi:general secretion pathway protein D